MKKVLFFIKKCLPKSVFKKVQPYYHFVLNAFASLLYGFPSNKLIVIGVTGTTGKTTVTFLLAKLLNNAGTKTGYTSTAMFGDGDREWLNDKKMTMVGRFFIQKILRDMVKNGCKVAIVETTSEGVVQFRHRFIKYDMLIFTGLYPEHIESHGGFENYKNAKLELFRHLERTNKKTKIPKTIIVNKDDKYADEFSNFEVDQIIEFSKENNCSDKNICVNYKYLETNKEGIKIFLNNQEIQLKLLGDFTATNVAAVSCAAKALDLDEIQIKDSLEQIEGVPGRLEKIPNEFGFTIIVDYAFEPVAITKLYETVSFLEPKNIIHVLGGTGGGRDTKRMSEIGAIAGDKAQFVIVTDEDPYDDDPMEIINRVAGGALNAGKIDNKDLFRILDRREAIKKALELAKKGDVILITGKGSEQAIVKANGVHIPWDDRKVVLDELTKIKKLR